MEILIQRFRQFHNGRSRTRSRRVCHAHRACHSGGSGVLPWTIQCADYLLFRKLAPSWVAISPSLQPHFVCCPARKEQTSMQP